MLCGMSRYFIICDYVKWPVSKKAETLKKINKSPVFFRTSDRQSRSFRVSFSKSNSISLINLLVVLVVFALFSYRLVHVDIFSFHSLTHETFFLHRFIIILYSKFSPFSFAFRVINNNLHRLLLPSI